MSTFLAIFAGFSMGIVFTSMTVYLVFGEFERAFWSFFGLFFLVFITVMAL